MNKEESKIKALLREKFKRAKLVIRANDQEKEYLRSLCVWEKTSKKKQVRLGGPIC